MNEAAQARPHAELVAEVLDPCRPKSEHEHAAAREIEDLRLELSTVKLRSESAEALARYKDQQGFTGSYAVAGREVAGALADEFGPNAINPPSVPVVIIGPDGEIEFRTGAKSVDEIVATVRG